MRTFRKTGNPAAIQTESASLRWLTDAGGAPVAELVEVGETWLTTRFLTSGSPDTDAAARFGRDLAATHAAGADWWGQGPPSFEGESLSTANLTTPIASEPRWESFGEYYSEARLRPYVEMIAGLDSDGVQLLHSACDAVADGGFDSPQPARCGEVARIHGDLWGGNVIWADGGKAGTLIDPVANGGHAETDLAELGVFGSPHLETTIAAYDEVSALADGWQDRVPLHQLHMLLVHATLFGGGYVGESLRIARSLLR